MDAWEILLDNSTLGPGHDVWEHLNNQAGDAGGFVLVDTAEVELMETQIDIEIDDSALDVEVNQDGIDVEVEQSEIDVEVE